MKLDGSEYSGLTGEMENSRSQMLSMRKDAKKSQPERTQTWKNFSSMPIHGFIAAVSLILAAAAMTPESLRAAPISIDLNRALKIGWYSMRVQNPFGTNYTGLTSIKSYNKQTQDFVFVNQQGQEVVINATDISFIYFRQLPDRSDVNVNIGDIRNIQITPYKERLYDIPPGNLVIEDGSLILNPRWRIAEKKPFGVNTIPPAPDGGTAEEIELPRLLQLKYLGNHYLVETELVNLLTRTTPVPSGGTVPSRLPILFPIPAPTANPAP